MDQDGINILYVGTAFEERPILINTVALCIVYDIGSKINREVTLTTTGVETHTWSDSDPQVGDWIQTHVAQMIRLLNTGGSIRRWDPLFREIFENHGDFSITVTNSTDGVYVASVGNTECAVNLAQFHAEVVSGFIEHGRAEVQRAHEVPEEC